MTKAFSEKDGVIAITVYKPGNIRDRFLVEAHKDGAFDPADAVTHQIGGGQVVFLAEGARKPVFKFTCTNGVEALSIRKRCLDSEGKCYPLTVSHAFRRPGVGSLSFLFEEAKLGKGGGYKVSDGEGMAGDPGFEFPMTRAKTSENGAAYVRTA